MQNDLAYLYHLINGLETKFKKRLVIELGDRLAATIGKEPAWSYKTLDNMLHNRVKITGEMSEAIRIYGSVLDGQTEIQARLHPIQAYSINGSVKDGSVILGKSRHCDYSQCQLLFVPVVHNQRFCCKSHRLKYWGEKKANE